VLGGMSMGSMTLFRRLWNTFVRTVTVVAGLFGLAMLTYLPYVFWETSKLNDLCEHIQPGLEVKALPALVERFGFASRWVERKGYTDREGHINVFVPTNSSVGDYGCEIVHDGNKVISATARR
jgi:hypothetical protein